MKFGSEISFTSSPPLTSPINKIESNTRFVVLFNYLYVTFGITLFNYPLLIVKFVPYNTNKYCLANDFTIRSMSTFFCINLIIDVNVKLYCFGFDF